jgi:hypothetical protein
MENIGATMDEIYLTDAANASVFLKIKKFLRPESCFVHIPLQPPVAAMAGRKPVAANAGGFFFWAACQ